MTAKNNEGLIVTGGNVQIGNAAIGQGASISVLMKESLAKAEAVTDKPELQQALKELCANVAELTKKLPAPEQTKVARDLESFVSEATSTNPRKSWYNLSGEGLIEAAKAVASLATPVATTVKTVLALLSL